MADLLPNIRDFLVAQNAVRLPRTAGALHPLFLEPRNGAVAPGGADSSTENDADVIVSAFIAPGIPPRTYESFWRTDGIDFWIRARTAPLAVQFEALLRDKLHGQQNVMMGAERIVQAGIFTSMRRLGSGPEGYTFLTGYLVQHYFPAVTV